MGSSSNERTWSRGHHTLVQRLGGPSGRPRCRRSPGQRGQLLPRPAKPLGSSPTLATKPRPTQLGSSPRRSSPGPELVRSSSPLRASPSPLLHSPGALPRSSATVSSPHGLLGLPARPNTTSVNARGPLHPTPRRPASRSSPAVSPSTLQRSNSRVPTRPRPRPAKQLFTVPDPHKAGAPAPVLVADITGLLRHPLLPPCHPLHPRR